MRVGRFFCGMLGGLSEEKLPRQKIISTNRFRFMSKKFYDNTVVSLYLFVLFLLYYHRQHQCQQYQHPRRHLCPSWMLRGTFSTLVTTPGSVEATNYPSEMLDASTRGRVFFCAIFTADHFYVGEKWVGELSTTFHSTWFFT